MNCIIPSLSIVHIHGTVQKDYEWIIISTSFILAPSLIISVCLRFLAINLAGSNNYARVDESLIISNDAIRYSFRIKHQSLASERYVVTLQFSEITAINFDSKMESLEFKGNIVSEYFDDNNNEKHVDTTSLSNFVIYDYFEPSLKQALESNGININ
ncbi:MAG: hypothetical protein IJ593_09210 [Lachnospiraceae bacterium]|nr:hypothetical protein [Lachnospiraceae bacterium]